MNLHEIVQRSYNKIKKLCSIEVLSENGWEDVNYVAETPKQQALEITIENKKLICSPDHILIDENGNEIFAKDSLNKKIKTKNGSKTVKSIKKINKKIKLYDLSLGDGSHTYYTNDILSHNCLILDEFAFLPKSVEDKLFASVYPVVSQDPNGKIIIVSTPNGKNNLFYQIWSQANAKDKSKNLDGWMPFQMYYWQVPGHDTPEWKAAQIAAIGEQRFQQEFNCQFLDSDTLKKLIPDEVIEKYRKQYDKFKNEKINQGKDLAIISENGKKTFTFRMFNEFDPKRTYLMTSDIAEGIGKDSSVLYVWDITDTSNIKMVLRFSDNNISILEFAYLTFQIAKMYNNPFLACEANGISLGYIEQLRVTYEYENFVRLNRENSCGIQSHVQVKSRACLWFRDMMTTTGFGFELNDLKLIDEFSTFIKKDLKVQNVYAAIGDNHDDHIMTMIWACWILNMENLEKYYVVGDTFTSSLGNEYPKTILPLFEYTKEECEAVYNIPQVKEFLTFKELNKEEFEMKKKQDEMKYILEMNKLGSDIKINPNEIPNRIVYSQEDMIMGRKNNNGAQIISQNEMLKELRGGNMSSSDRGMYLGTGYNLNNNDYDDFDFMGKSW